MNESIKKEVEFFLCLNEDQLLAMLGQFQQVYAIGRMPNALERGKHWLEHHQVLLYGKLCIQEHICTKISSSGFGDKITLVLSIADIICGLLTGVPPFVVSALLVKRGIKNFCHCGHEINDERRREFLGRAVIWHNNLSHEISELEKRDQKSDNLLDSRQKTLKLVRSVVQTLYHAKYADLLQAYGVPIPLSKNG